MRFAIIGGKEGDRVLLEMPEEDVLIRLVERTTRDMRRRKAAKIEAALRTAWADTRAELKKKTVQLPV